MPAVYSPNRGQHSVNANANQTVLNIDELPFVYLFLNGYKKKLLVDNRAQASMISFNTACNLVNHRCYQNNIEINVGLANVDLGKFNFAVCNNINNVRKSTRTRRAPDKMF